LEKRRVALNKYNDEMSLVKEKTKEIASLTTEARKIFNERKNNLDNLIKELEIADREFETLREEGFRFESNADRLANQLKMIEETEKNLTKVPSGSKTLLDATAKGMIKSKFTALTQNLIVKKEGEKAMAAVLGELWDALVVEEDADFLQILEFIEKNELSKTVLMVNDTSIFVKSEEKILHLAK